MFIVQNMLEASKVKDSKGLAAVVEAEPRQCAHVPKKQVSMISKYHNQ